MEAFRIRRGDTYATFRPTYLSLTERANLSRHTGRPILEGFNEIYHYWTTTRNLSPEEVINYLGEGYLRNMA